MGWGVEGSGVGLLGEAWVVAVQYRRCGGLSWRGEHPHEKVVLSPAQVSANDHLPEKAARDLPGGV